MFQVDQLHTLVVVIEEGTFEAAARRLRLTASAVSQRIKAMEQAAGQILLQRVNPVVPTEAGAVVLRYGRQMELLASDAARDLGGIAGADGEWVSLPIAVNADSLATWFLPALAAVPRSLGVVFDILREDQEHTTELLRSGSAMAAVTSTAEAVQGCTSIALGRMRYRAVCSPSFATEWMLLRWSISIAKTTCSAPSSAPVWATNPTLRGTTSPRPPTLRQQWCSGSAGRSSRSSSALRRLRWGALSSWPRRITLTFRSTGSAGTCSRGCSMRCQRQSSRWRRLIFIHPAIQPLDRWRRPR
jgi:hypothetical protein